MWLRMAKIGGLERSYEKNRALDSVKDCVAIRFFALHEANTPSVNHTVDLTATSRSSTPCNACLIPDRENGGFSETMEMQWK
ncbi:MAG: hypothetical protein CL981_04435 [Euryarchaeota archaeon]|nr:hypothetical protein [Euryarchaeota archaeon]MAP42958.1 hypothetical protein [Euryarchaeota archaeon]